MASSLPLVSAPPAPWPREKIAIQEGMARFNYDAVAREAAQGVGYDSYVVHFRAVQCRRLQGSQSETGQL